MKYLIDTAIKAVQSMAVARGDFAIAHMCAEALNGDLVARQRLIEATSYETINAAPWLPDGVQPKKLTLV